MIFYKTKSSETIRVDGGGNSGETCEDCLPKTNTIPFTPTGDYNPATKKYVDDLVGDISIVLDAINRKPGGDSSGDNNSTAEPFYLYDGNAGINKLGNFTPFVQSAIDGSPQISVSDTITITINKGAQISVLYQIKHNNFGINNIEQYSKITIEYEYTSGIFTYDTGLAFFDQGRTSCRNYIPLNTSTDDSSNQEIGNNSTIYGYDTDKIRGTKYHILNSYEKTLFTSTTSTERLGFLLTVSFNNVIDTVFKIYKIWLE